MITPNYILSREYNPKQVELYNGVVLACSGQSKARTFVLGGAIRGGKTFGVLIVLDRLCREYPNSRWAIIRADLPRLLRTTIPSLEKVTKGSLYCKWYRSASDLRLRYNNGSSIHFIPENATKDPQMTRLLGFECNGVFLEQAEELTRKCYDMAISRVGTWILPKMPPKLMFLTFNPADGWFKEEFHDKYIQGILPDNCLYIHALPTDNKAITAEQFEHWAQMPKDLYEQFVLGDWSAVNREGIWFYNFNKSRHVGSRSIVTNAPLYVSIDWNFAKFCAIIYQRSPGYGAPFISVIDEIVLLRANISDMAAEIRRRYYGHYVTQRIIITGDKTGSKHDVGMESTSSTYITMLQKLLNVPDENMLFGQIDYISPLRNLDLRSSWSLCNHILATHGNFVIDASCTHTIADIQKAKHDDRKGNCNLYKTPATGDYDMGLADCFRYMIHEATGENFIKHIS